MDGIISHTSELLIKGKYAEAFDNSQKTLEKYPNDSGELFNAFCAAIYSTLCVGLDEKEYYLRFQKAVRYYNSIKEDEYLLFPKDRYSLEDVLGCGGTGVVLKAKDLNEERYVAIKVLYPFSGCSDAELSRLENEIAAMKQLKSELVPKAYSFSVEPHPHIVMEYIHGDTLHKLVTNQRLTLKQKIVISENIIKSICFIHKTNILHRDIKPSNIIVLKKKQVKIIDFGYVKTEVPLTKTGTIIGTSDYVAPEILREEKACQQSDIFSLGKTLIFIFTENPHDIHSVPPHLHKCIKKATSINKRSRYLKIDRFRQDFYSSSLCSTFYSKVIFLSFFMGIIGEPFLVYIFSTYSPLQIAKFFVFFPFIYKGALFFGAFAIRRGESLLFMIGRVLLPFSSPFYSFIWIIAWLRLLSSKIPLQEPSQFMNEIISIGVLLVALVIPVRIFISVRNISTIPTTNQRKIDLSVLFGFSIGIVANELFWIFFFPSIVMSHPKINLTVIGLIITGLTIGNARGGDDQDENKHEGMTINFFIFCVIVLWLLQLLNQDKSIIEGIKNLGVPFLNLQNN